jgi:hypothetical protein
VLVGAVTKALYLVYAAPRFRALGDLLRVVIGRAR